MERSNKNPNVPTGDVEVVRTSLNHNPFSLFLLLSKSYISPLRGSPCPIANSEVPTSVEVLSKSKVPPFTIKDETDGKEVSIHSLPFTRSWCVGVKSVQEPYSQNLRMQYRYLDIRRNPVREKLILRHKCVLSLSLIVAHISPDSNYRTTQSVRNYLSKLDFVEVETPMLIKSTPEGARDFVHPLSISCRAISLLSFSASFPVRVVCEILNRIVGFTYARLCPHA